MKRLFLIVLTLLSVLAVGWVGRAADVKEEKQVIKTYPFSGTGPRGGSRLRRAAPAVLSLFQL